METIRQTRQKRLDIQGLRAIAVLAVLLYHMEIPWFGGGLSGVDVFYVISGFLITGIVIRPGFSFADFYARRVARLVPALAVTLLLTLAAGYVLMDAATFQSVAMSAVFSMLGTSNIYYTFALDYFSDDLFSWPLKHTWSLSLEWQFYLLWPLLLVAARKIGGQRGIPVAVIATIVLSLAAEQAFTSTAPQSVFYNLPFRAFELALGGAVLLLPALPARVKEVAGIVGLCLILAGIFAMPESAAFPGWWALLPVVGTAAVIAGNGQIAGRALSWKPMVVIGDWSYSLYLVHWPILTFARYLVYRELTPVEMAVTTLAIFLSAAALRYAVEMPGEMKKHGVFTGHNGFRLAATVLLVLASINASTFVVSAVGFPNRVATDYKLSWFGHMPCGTEGNKASLLMTECKFGTPGKGRILIVGDSHSRQFAHGLSTSSLANDYEFTSVFWGSCIPLISKPPLINGTPDPKCIEAGRLASERLAQPWNLVILTARWKGYRTITKSDLEAFTRRTHNKVVLIGPTPFPGGKIPCNRPIMLFGSCEAFHQDADDRMIDATYKSYASSLGLPYIDLFDAGCPKNVCPFYLDKTAVYADVNHLSEVGSDYYVHRFEKQIRSALGQ